MGRLRTSGEAAPAELQMMLRDAAQRSYDAPAFRALGRPTRERALAALDYLNRLSRYGVTFRSEGSRNSTQGNRAVKCSLSLPPCSS